MRKNDEIPAVLYGGEKVIHFSVTNNAVRNLVYTPNIYAVELTIDGEKKTVVMKDIQFHPVTDAILHIDFLEVCDTKPIVMEVPVILEGHAEGVKAGGKLQLQMRKLKVKAVYTNIPERLNIDVTSLGLGKTIKVGELHFEGLELVTSKEVVVCQVKMTRGARSAASADN